MKTIIDILTVSAFISKTVLHLYIAEKNGRSLILNGISDSWEFFWFYTKPVTKETLAFKKSCNISWTSFLILVIVSCIL